MELFFNPDLTNDDAGGAYGSDTKQIRFNRNYSGLSGQNLPDSALIAFSQVETDSGWVLELAIAWQGILPESISLTEALSLGFEIAVSDRDSGPDRDHVLVWNNDTGEDKAYMDTRYFGFLELQDQRAIKSPRTAYIDGKPNVTVEIDGLAQEAIWDDTNPLPVDRLVPKETDEYPSEADLNAYFKVFYNADDLYIYVNVKDDSLVKYNGVSDTYQFDNIEVYVNPDLANDATSGAYGSDAMQIRFNLGRTDAIAGSAKLPLADDWEVAFAENDEGYSAEIRLGWNSIFSTGLGLNPPMSIGFEILVSDNDGATSGGNLHGT
ncbi:MAG: hypothetical protein HC842_06770 [Cytophagales bacterium]|nr:hypothetical protein [Cytophagales bacterium]